MKKFPCSELAKLRTKPSDFHRGIKGHQMTIDDYLAPYLDTKYDETLVIKCNAHISLQDIVNSHKEFVRQRKYGVIVLPENFEVVGYFPSDSAIKVVDDTNDAEKFIDDFVKGKYD